MTHRVSEVERLTANLRATVGDDNLVVALRALLAVARDEQRAVEVERLRDTLAVQVRPHRVQLRLPSAA